MSYREDPVFQTVQQIRTPGAVEEVLASAWRRWSGKQPHAVQVTPVYTNYKPFKRARVMAEAIVVPGPDDAPAVALNLFLHVFAGVDAARAEVEQGHARGFLPCEGPPLFYVPSWRTVVWTLPNAPNLAELGQLTKAEHFCRLLVPSADVPVGRHYYPRPRLMRYVPLKRAILTWDDPYARRRYFVKLLNGADAPRVAGNFTQINAAFERGELGFAVPQLIAYNPVYRTLMMTEVAGSSFTDVMRRALPEPFAQVGGMLAQLHGSSACPEVVWAPDKELTVLRRHTADFKRALPHLGMQLDGVVARLEAVSHELPCTPGVPIHGNLFGDQILAHRHGMGIVDWDTLSLGDPLYDVGRLIAHFIYIAGCGGIAPPAVSACAEALLQTYGVEAGRPVDRQRLAWHVATQLLLRGKISALRQLPEGWQSHLAFVVAEATRVIDGRGRYLRLPTLHEVAVGV
jgi:hypothetical protein